MIEFLSNYPPKKNRWSQFDSLLSDIAFVHFMILFTSS